jgi:4-hydroxythreonine-4-phosphate dehydrogenase
VTLGDPRGIGAEVALAAARTLRAEGPEPPVLFVGAPEQVEGVELPGWTEFRPTQSWDGSEEGAGRVSIAALRTAVELAMAGTVGAVVTAPVHKPALHAAGWAAPGQTEMLQELSGAAEVGMLMCAERTRLGAPLRVLLATTHLPLREVPTRVTEERLVTQATLLDGALRSGWRILEPRLALCALNPHASDRGLFGDEEARVMEPAVARLREAGVEIAGPLPADTVFSRALSGDFDAVVAPYHDVGMAAFKTVSFGSGVNVTLGLPFVRTSPDHGTAFDIAGRGRADPASMLEALRLAVRLANASFDTSGAAV